MGVAIRDAGAEDGEFILALNAACVPEVSEMDADGLAALRGWAHRVLIAEVAGAPAAFVILVAPETTYDSDNYRWFEQRFARHLYVDRICVSEAGRGRGVGRALYERAMTLARELGADRLTAEVNEQPPNPDSMAFHVRMGFNTLASRPSRAGKVVAMLERVI